MTDGPKLMLRPLLNLMAKEGDNRVLTAAKFARLVDDHLANVRPALDAGWAEEAQAKQWAIAAGFDPDVVWPLDPIDPEERMGRVRASQPLVEAVKKATDDFIELATGPRPAAAVTLSAPNTSSALDQPEAVPGLRDGDVIALPGGATLTLEFHDALPPRRADARSRAFSYRDALESVLKSNPGRWLRIREVEDAAKATALRKRVANALGKGFEVAVRPNKPTDTAADPHFVWVRWVG